MLKQENLAANLYGLLAQKRRGSDALEWRILGQELDGCLLASWVSQTVDKDYFSNIGVYNPKEKTFEILYSFNKKINIVQASVNLSRTLLLYVIKEDKTATVNGDCYSAYLAVINNSEPGDCISLLENSKKQIMTQFIWPKPAHFVKKNQDRFLVLHHEENVIIYTAFFKATNQDQAEIINYNDPNAWRFDRDNIKNDVMIKKFIWAQFDVELQVLYHIKSSSSFDKEDERTTPVLSALQFHDDLPTETVLNIPLNLPKISPGGSNVYDDDPVPLRVHDSSLNLIILGHESGQIYVCHYYLYQPVKQADEDGSIAEMQDVHFAYSVTTLHHGCVVHCIIPDISWEKAKHITPTFTLHGDHHLLVFEANMFMHLLDVGMAHEPCCHVVCPPSFGRHNGNITHLVPCFRANSIAFDAVTLDLISIKIPKSHLIEAFKNDKSVDNRLSIVHYFLAHSNDIDIFSELLNIIMERPLNLDTVSLLKEAMIGGAFASAQKGLPSDALALLKLLPLTTANITKPLHAKIGDLSVNISHETLHNTTMMLLSPQQRLSPYKADIWTKCYEKLNENKDWKRFHPDQVIEKLMYSLAAYQPEALSRCTTPMSPSTSLIGTSFAELGATSNARRNPYDVLPFPEVEQCTASKQEHVISVNLRELSMHLVKYSVKQTSGFRWLKDYFDRNPAPTHVHAVATRYVTAQLELSRTLCTLVCRSANLDARIEADRGFSLIDQMPATQQYILYTMLERYYLATESLAFPLPQGFSSFISYLGYRALPFDTYYDHIKRHVFELQIDVMKHIMNDLDDSKENVNRKLGLLATLPRSRAKRLLNSWNHTFSLMSRSRQHAHNILSGNQMHSRGPSANKKRFGSLVLVLVQMFRLRNRKRALCCSLLNSSAEELEESTDDICLQKSFVHLYYLHYSNCYPPSRDEGSCRRLKKLLLMICKWLVVCTILIILLLVFLDRIYDFLPLNKILVSNVPL